ncbi:hypothetical protein [Mucilaginibacter sp.]|uniref:hypothetical protein n=1 Tax=Mucilaginibacter sp. TaxID=1882438 RepID=UPI003D1075E6
MARVYTVEIMNKTWEELDKNLHNLYQELTIVIGERAARLFGTALGGADFLLCIADGRDGYAEYELNDIEQDLVNFGTALVENKGKVSDELFDILVPHYTSKELVILVSFAVQLTAANLFYNVFELTASDSGY